MSETPAEGEAERLTPERTTGRLVHQLDSGGPKHLTHEMKMESTVTPLPQSRQS